MADANQGKRPMSPHISIYKLPLNANISILHRISGVAMAGSGLLIIWWLLAAATSESYFGFVNGILTSWFGDIILTLSVFGLWFHFANGIRHLIWDTGSNFGQKRVTRSAISGVTLAVILTCITIYIA